jgi:hypothetical protein
MNLENTSLKRLIIHYVGSKNNLEPVYTSKTELEMDDEMQAALQNSFLTRFRLQHEKYSFTHPSSLQFNELYNYCRQLFQDPEELVSLSASMASHLYEQSTHPKVKGGELYVAYFEGLPVEGRMYKAIAIFKTENKSLFLDVQKRNHQLQLNMREGVELTKMDKGCLIINSREEEGYDVLLFDNQSRGEEAAYWKEKFLQVVPQKDEFHHTQQLLTLTRQFITDQLETEHPVSRTDQVELLHKSLDYFKTRDNFDIDEFQKEVFVQEEMIDSFRRFGSRFVDNTDYDIAASFEISPDAVKKQSRVYKSVLKLDRNFHIYIHGRTDLIERGTDADGRKFYKIYYQEEN